MKNKIKYTMSGKNGQKRNDDPCKEKFKSLYFLKEKKIEEWIEKWITQGPDENMIKYAEAMAKCISKVSSSQLRNIYGEVMRIKLKGYKNSKNAFLLLKPKVAYNYARISKNDKDEKKQAFRNFKYLFDKAYEIIVQEKNEDKAESAFKNFVNLFEAILAYHKQHGKD